MAENLSPPSSGDRGGSRSKGALAVAAAAIGICAPQHRDAPQGRCRRRRRRPLPLRLAASPAHCESGAGRGLRRWRGRAAAFFGKRVQRGGRVPQRRRLNRCGARAPRCAACAQMGATGDGLVRGLLFRRRRRRCLDTPQSEMRADAGGENRML